MYNITGGGGGGGRIIKIQSAASVAGWTIYIHAHTQSHRHTIMLFVKIEISQNHYQTIQLQFKPNLYLKKN